MAGPDLLVETDERSRGGKGPEALPELLLEAHDADRLSGPHGNGRPWAASLERESQRSPLDSMGFSWVGDGGRRQGGWEERSESKSDLRGSGASQRSLEGNNNALRSG